MLDTPQRRRERVELVDGSLPRRHHVGLADCGGLLRRKQVEQPQVGVVLRLVEEALGDGRAQLRRASLARFRRAKLGERHLSRLHENDVRVEPILADRVAAQLDGWQGDCRATRRPVTVDALHQHEDRRREEAANSAPACKTRV